MMKIPVILVGEDSIALASLRQQLERDLSFVVQKKPQQFSEATEVLRKTSGPVLVVVDLGREVEKMFQAAQDFKLRFPDVHLVMTSADSSSQVILQALRSGAEEFFSQPFNWPEVVQSLERLRERISVQMSSHKQSGHLVTVFSSKGGVGTTTVTTNLGIGLTTAHEKDVCLVDLVLQFGALTSFLNLDASYTILDFVKNVQRIDNMFLEGSLAKHGSGLRVLAEPSYAEEAGKITAGDIEQVLDALLPAFDYVLVDSPKEFDETSFVALDKSDLILFVLEMSIPALRSAHKALESLERLRIDTKKVRLLMNRYQKSRLLTPEAVEKALGLQTFYALPNDYPTAIAALNQGIPIQEASPSSKLAKSYRGLADALIRELSVVPSHKLLENTKKAGLLSRLLPMRSAQ
ncbi:MAG: AAA family ATPase [Candidatus Binatia bacterium]